MTPKHWWGGVAAIVLAVLLHALLPRYEWHAVQGVLYTRVDRWTGQAVLVAVPRQP